MSRGRQIAAAVLIGVAALVYGLSPLDVLPDILGPLGLADDFAVLAGAGFAIWKLLSGGKPDPGTPPPGATPPAP